MSERVRTLTALAQGEKGLFIVPLNGFKKWLTPVDLWKDHQMTLKVGQDIDVDAFLNKLVNMGYRRESVVSHIGEVFIAWWNHRYISVDRNTCENRAI